MKNFIKINVNLYDKNQDIILNVNNIESVIKKTSFVTIICLNKTKDKFYETNHSFDAIQKMIEYATR